MGNEIEALLPHREPFLFVDEILEAGREKITGVHTFTEKEFFFEGHFPGYPVVPGVILIETMAQTGGAGLRKMAALDPANAGGLEKALFFLASVDKVKFRRQVRPGEKVRSEVITLRSSAKMIKQSGKAYVGDELAAEAEWLCLIG